MKKDLFAVLVLAIILLNACTQQTTRDKTSPLESNTVMINHLIFEPSSLVTDVGKTVTWKHDDNVAHTVVSQGLFESEILNRGEEYTFTFTEPGEYNYHCSIHPSMNGKIIVK
jgi:plastocyanin